MTAAPPSTGGDAAPLYALLQIEHALRQAESETAFRHTAVTLPRDLLGYRQAMLIRRRPDGRWRVDGVSDVAVLERDAPYIRWLERIAPSLAAAAEGAEPRAVEATAVAEAERPTWAEFLPTHGLWVPLVHPDGMVLGGLLLVRDDAFNEAETVLAGRLADTLAHAWRARVPGRWRGAATWRRRRLVLIGLAVAVLALLLLPVSQSTLAPGRVVPRDPVIVAAPLDGVIEAVHVDPNAAVAEGDLLITFEDSMLRNALAVAEEELAVAEAELRTATQGAFASAEGRGRLAVLRSRVELRRAERDWAAERLSRVAVRAEQDGIAVFGDASDWVGRPVKTGQKVMQIANPQAVELSVHVPVDDAVALEPGAEVRIFLDVAPLDPLDAELVHAAYEPALSDAQVLGYPVTARFLGAARPRIGLQGTAKIAGPPAPLALHLFRRPLAALRQYLGL